jgi:hypothetical protein
MILPNGYNLNNSAQEKADAITTLEGYPSEITLSENLRNFLFQPVETSPFGQTLANAQFVLLGYVPVGSTLTYNFEGFSIALTASATPTSGEFWTESVALIPVNAAYLQKVAESVADALDQILSVRNSYNVNLLGSTVSLEAKNYGSKFNVTISTSIPTIIAAYATAGTSKYTSQAKIDYSAWVKLYIGNEAFADLVDKYDALEVDFYAIDSAETHVNLSAGVVSDFVQPIIPIKKLTPSNDFFKMDLGTTGGGATIPSEDPTGAKQFLLRPYFIVYGDSWREVANGQKKRFVKGVTPVRWVQLGAFDHLRPYDMNEFVWIPNSPNSFKWLSTAPEKEVTYNSHEYLQLICKKPATANNFNLEVKCNFYDGTSVTVAKPTFSASGLAGNISFDVSPLALDLLTIETANAKLIDTYSIKLKWTAAGSAIGYSQIKTYKFVRDCNNKSNRIMFLNEFGAWDCLEFRGEVQKNTEREVNYINRALPPNANKAAAINAKISLNIETNSTDNFTIHSGLLSKEVYDWSSKLLDSSDVYLWNEDLADYEAIKIVDYDYGFDTKQGGGSLSITYNRNQNNTISQ